MKKIKELVLAILLAFTSSLFYGQSASVGNPTYFNPIKVMDNQGKIRLLEQIKILPSGSANYPQSLPAPVSFSTAGYYKLYFGNGSGMTGMTAVEQQRRDVLCQVFKDLSSFMPSHLNMTGNYVNIYIDDIINFNANAAVQGIYGIATPYYAEAFNMSNTGIVPGEVWKTIKLGWDSYTNTQPIASSNFYHGTMAFNFINSGINWYYSLSTNTIAPSESDFYTVALHEALHLLGFGSLIASNGNPVNQLPPAPQNTYYSFYDSYLRNPSNSLLISNSSFTCTRYGHVANVPATNLVGGCSACASSCYTNDITNCTVANKYAGISYTVPIYTPGCFQDGASLSHFEDLCVTPNVNNNYFLMSNAQPVGSSALKRYLKHEERSVLCDLGYSVNATNSSTVFGASFTYSTPAWQGIDIAGTCDGISASAFSFITVAGVGVSISNICANDRNAGGGYACVEVLSAWNGTLSATSGASNTAFTYTPAAPGLHILRYLPKNLLGQLGNITYIYVLATPNFSTCSTTACNLVRNGGFEQGTTPTGISEIARACGWETANAGTPDYFSTAATFTNDVKIPCNVFGNEGVAGGIGNAHVGIYSVNDNVNFPYNEVLYTKLTNSLQPNTAYKLTFDVSLAEGASGQIYPLQAYFSSNPSFVSVSQNSVNIANPSMLFTTANNFSISNGWQQATINFTTNSTGGEEYIALGNLNNNTGTSISPATAPSCSIINVPNWNYYYIDNITLVVNNTASFNLPVGACTNQTVSLNALTSPSGGVFSGPGVANNLGNYSFSSSTVGWFTIAYTYTLGGCQYTTFKQIQVGPPHTVSASTNTNNICTNLSQTSATLTANSTTSGVNWVWQPISSTITPVVVSPTVSTTYTVTGYNQGCPSSATIAVNVQTSCCTSTLTPYVGNPNIPSATFGTSRAFNYDVFITPGNPVFLQGTEFQFAPNVKITVKNGAVLYIDGSHLYSCNDMWQGIVVEDGGNIKIYRLNSSKDNLIEDAITAVDIQNQVTTPYNTYGSILQVKNTTFNRNFTAISIDNFVRNYSPYPFEIHNNVFTSRAITSTPSSWPTNSVTAGSLRAITGSSTGIAVPFLLGSFAPANLKAPYNTQPSHIGIKLTTVGSSTGTIQYGILIGNQTNANDYNIFDGLGQGIEATNSNVNAVNNVFQNTKQYTFDPPGPAPAYTYGGNAIRSLVTTLFNARLNLSPTGLISPALNSLGNRFYDCHYAVNCDKVFLLNVSFATMRSTHTASNTSAVTGSVGVVSRTNRFLATINNNNIANIHTPINIAVSPDNYNYNGSSGYGVYANALNIQNNYIGSQTTTAAPTNTTQYVNQAITISAPVGSAYQVGNPAFAITTNTIDRVFRGIEINNFSKTNFVTNTSTNTIKLADDNVFNLPQTAIKYTDNYIGTLRSNTLSGTGITNTLITLFYAANSLSNPTVICNSLSNAYVGFQFNSNNSNLYWRGNVMNNHQRGMVLSNNGIIGTQGSSGNPIENLYNGSWAGRNCTWTSDAATFASNSPMWVKNIGVLPNAPVNNSGIPNPQSYGSGWINNTTGAFPGCGTGGGGGGGGGAFMASSSAAQVNTLTDEMKYIQDFGDYQTLKSSSTLLSSTQSNQTFVSSNSNSSMDKFLKVDGLYYAGNLASAKALNTSITCTNTAESLNKAYYNLYDKFITNAFTSFDNNALSYIAELCPGTNGTAVFKARALYNYINQTARIYSDNCATSANASREANDILQGINSINKLQIDLFPNPAQNFVTLYSNQLNESLNIVITDVGGKVIQEASVVSYEHLATIDLKLQNGIYFVTITNTTNDKIVKKLIITK